MNSIFEYQFSLFLLFLLFDLFYTKSYKKIKNQYSKTSKYLFHFILLHDIILTQKMILIQKTKVEAKHENFLDEKDIFQEKESSVVRFNWKKILFFFCLQSVTVILFYDESDLIKITKSQSMHMFSYHV